MMDATVRVRSVAGVAGVVVLAVICTLLVTQAWSVGAAPGDEDSTFVPTAGCRVVDTRPAPNTIGLRSTPLGAGEVFEVTVHGENGDCTGPLAIPSDAVGVALNVTAVNATERSNIRIYPADLAEVPTLSNLNVTAGAPATPNKVDVKLSPDGKIRVFNFAGSVNIFIDVVGYYTNSSLQELVAELAAKANTADVYTRSELYTRTEIDSRLGMLSDDVADASPKWVVKSDNGPNANGRVSSPEFQINRFGPGNYRADFGDLDVSGCTWSATPSAEPTGLPAGFEVRTAIDGTDSTRVVVRTTDSSGSAVDSGWHVQVFC